MPQYKSPQGVIVNLDEGEFAGATILLRFSGVVLPLHKERLLELLAREQAYFASLGSSGPSSSEVASEAQPTTGSGGSSHKPRLATKNKPGISHAGLSVRLKRMYTYNLADRRLRAPHAEHLSEVLRAFDWVLPEHPNTLLDFHLKEIASWSGVSADLRREIDVFLARYTEMRYRRGAS